MSEEKPTKEQKPLKPHAPDYLLLVSLLFLVFLGVLMVYSASYYSAEVRKADATQFFQKQLFSAVFGAVLLIVTLFIDYHFYKKVRWVLLFVGIGALLLVWVPGIGVNINGSHRWLDIGGLSLQPSEVLKACLILFIATNIGQSPKGLESAKFGILPYLIITLLVCVPLLLQPNFSAVVCVSMLVVIMLIVGGAKMWQIWVVVGVGVVALCGLVVIAEYRVARLLAFLDPFSENTEATYQLRQSLYSIASGGFFGRGLGNSMQKLMYLPFSESDFIFAIVVEEFGFFGALTVLGAFFLFVYRGVRIAMRAPDLTGTLIASGIVGIIAIQVIINIGVVAGVFPPTGVVLPFISYGGSGVAIFMAMVGILLNISRQTVRAVRVPNITQL